jgi:hypothetical protein
MGASHGLTTNESEFFSDESSKSNSTISGFSNGFSVFFEKIYNIMSSNYNQ